MSYSSVGWTSSPVLPLGMRLTDLKTREDGTSSHFVLKKGNEIDVDYLDLDDVMLRFSAYYRQKPSDNCDIRSDHAPSTEPNLSHKKSINPRVARIQEFIKKYNINLSKRSGEKMTTHKCIPTWQNPKNFRKCQNKMLHYYNLLRGPRKKEVEHPEIVKFRRFYNTDRQLHYPPMPIGNDYIFVSPSVAYSPSTPEKQLNVFNRRIQSPVSQNYKLCHFTSKAYLKDMENLKNSVHVGEPRKKSVSFKGDLLTIDDLIRHNSSADKSTPQMKLPSMYNQHLPNSSDNEMSCVVAGAGSKAATRLNSNSSFNKDSRCTHNQYLPNLSENVVTERKLFAISTSTFSDTSINITSSAKADSPVQTDSQENNFVPRSVDCVSGSFIFSAISNGVNYVEAESSYLMDSQRIFFQSSPKLSKNITVPSSPVSVISNSNVNVNQTTFSSPCLADSKNASYQYSPNSPDNLASANDNSNFSDISIGDKNHTDTNFAPLTDEQHASCPCGPNLLQYNGKTEMEISNNHSIREIENVKTYSVNNKNNGSPYIKYSLHASNQEYSYRHNVSVPKKCYDFRRGNSSVSGIGKDVENYSNTGPTFFIDSPVYNCKINDAHSSNIMNEAPKLVGGNSAPVELSTSSSLNSATDKVSSLSNSFMKKNLTE